MTLIFYVQVMLPRNDTGEGGFFVIPGAVRPVGIRFPAAFVSRAMHRIAKDADCHGRIAPSQ